MPRNSRSNVAKSATSIKNKGKSKPKKTGAFFTKLLLVIRNLIISFLVFSAGLVFLYRYVNPPFTPLMIIRTGEFIMKGEKIRFRHQWAKLKNISPYVSKATLAAEDQKFYEHNGFDVDAIYTAYKDNKLNKGLRGGSTISQQAAKNVFLWPERSWIRKVLESYFTVLIEWMWTKERILEVYLNVIEMGQGIYGIEAASKFYFYKSAKNITKEEAAAIASVYPFPLKWKPVNNSPFLLKKRTWIMIQAESINNRVN